MMFERRAAQARSFVAVFSNLVANCRLRKRLLTAMQFGVRRRCVCAEFARKTELA
jgi:hypothetical protein